MKTNQFGVLFAKIGHSTIMFDYNDWDFFRQCLSFAQSNGLQSPWGCSGDGIGKHRIQLYFLPLFGRSRLLGPTDLWSIRVTLWSKAKVSWQMSTNNHFCSLLSSVFFCLCSDFKHFWMALTFSLSSLKHFMPRKLCKSCSYCSLQIICCMCKYFSFRQV